MNFLQKLFPRHANNDYQGSKIALNAFGVICVVFLFRALIHFLAPDSGVNSIASIIQFQGDPDPNHIIYMFSALGGAMQLMMVLIYIIVLVRYRSLVPLMYALLLVETAFRYIVARLHPLTPEYFAHRPPDTYAELPILIVSIIMLYLSTRTISGKDIYVN